MSCFFCLAASIYCREPRSQLLRSATWRRRLRFITIRITASSGRRRHPTHIRRLRRQVALRLSVRGRRWPGSPVRRRRRCRRFWLRRTDAVFLRYRCRRRTWIRRRTRRIRWTVVGEERTFQFQVFLPVAVVMRACHFGPFWHCRTKN